MALSRMGGKRIDLIPPRIKDSQLMNSIVKIFVSLAILAYISPLFAQENAPKDVQSQERPAQARKDISTQSAKKDEPIAMAFVTRQDPGLDFSFRVLPNRMVVHTIQSAYKNEELTLLFCVANMVGDDCKYDTDYSVRIQSPDGKWEYILKDKNIKGTLGDKNFLQFLGDTVTLIFEDADAFGKYRVELSARNKLNGKTGKSITDIELKPWENLPLEFDDSRSYMLAIMKYNEGFLPENLYRIYKSKFSSLLTKKGKVNYMLYMFLREAFKAKPFLLEKLAEEFDTAMETERINDILIFAALGKSQLIAKKEMTQREKKLSDIAFKAVTAIPSAYEKSFTSAAFDLLWGEFYAKGTYAPIEKLMSYYKNYDAAEKYVEAYEKGQISKLDSKTVLEASKFLSLTYSILSNIKGRLAMDYVYYYAKANKIPPQDLKKSLDLCVRYMKTYKANAKGKKAPEPDNARQKPSSAPIAN